MSGKITGSTSWGRAGIRALAEETIAAIEAAIPDDHDITVIARTKPGDWSVRLLQGHRSRHPVVVAEVFGQPDVAAGCWAVLHAYREAVA